jgi:hypothetical protein
VIFRDTGHLPAGNRRVARTQHDPTPIKEQTMTVNPCPAGCTQDRRGYQWHQRTHHLPACEASKQASAAYMRDYYDRTGRYSGIVRRRKARARSGR